MAGVQDKQCAGRPTANWDQNPSSIHRASLKRAGHAVLCTHTVEEKANSTGAASSTRQRIQPWHHSWREIPISQVIRGEGKGTLVSATAPTTSSFLMTSMC